MPYAQRMSAVISVSDTGATEIDVTGYANVRIIPIGDDLKIAFDSVSLDSQYFTLPNGESAGMTPMSLDGINCTLYLRRVGVGILCNAHLICWN